MTREEQIERAAAALCRFVFPGVLVPRLEMATAVLAAAADESEDWLEHLPPKRIVDALALVNIKGAGNLSDTMGTLNAAVGAGNMKMQDLVDALGTGVLPAAKLAGLSLQDVMGALAVFTKPVERHFTDEEYNAKCNELVAVVIELVDLRKAARQIDERWSEFWERSVSGYDATQPRERLREARAALHASWKPSPRPRERTPMPDPNQKITVTASRQSWEALTRISPLSEMTYTPDGIEAYEAFQAIQQALHGPQGPEAGA